MEYKLAEIKGVQVANWDGIVMGSGYGITHGAPFRIATENTVFAMPEARLGIFTDICSCFFLSKLRNYLGFYLGMTGARLRGEDAYISGLANYFIPRKYIKQVFNQIKADLPFSDNASATIKGILEKHHQPSGRNTLPNQEDIRDIFGLDNFRDIYQAASEREDDFGKKITKSLNDQCPFSVGVIHHLIQTAKSMSYKECFLRDFKLWQHYIVDPNFSEGVRTVLVEKGSIPKWTHQHILDITDEEVGKVFKFPDSFKTLNI